ncbi:MAG TPA: protein-L-isoaspartate(D-aspartate) O-methyltransferase [Phycisphaerae bacterium]|nr:protein-L-isoaspartate(D-aspartate) O-methyltransferase [Phycisphaerae bacterium]
MRHGRTTSSSLEDMVNRQVADRGIADPRVLAALREVDRAAFVPSDLQAEAYDDHPLDIGCGQTISQPYMVALMTAELELAGTERVLEIGTGSGYQTAILARLAREVYTVECVAELSRRAMAALAAMGVANVCARVGDGTLGWPDAAPFDRILATAAAPDVPPPLVEQLAEPGIAIVPVGPRSIQNLVKVTKEHGQVVRTEFCPCVFVAMRGRYGFE